MAVEIERPRRLFTIEEYEKMVETGILTKYDRVELIEGEIVEMSPIGNPHAAFVANLNHLLVRGRRPGSGVAPGAGPRAAALGASAGSRTPTAALVRAGGSDDRGRAARHRSRGHVAPVRSHGEAAGLCSRRDSGVLDRRRDRKSVV